MSAGYRCLGVLGLLCALSVLGTGHAHAKLDGKAWKAAQAEYEKLFQELGSADEKVAVLETIVGDGSARAWKLLGKALTVQSARVAEIRGQYAKAAAIHGDILLATIKGYSPDQESRAKDVQRRMKGLEESHADEGRVLDALIGLLAAAPSNARRAAFKVAKPKAPVPLRVAAARIAGRSLADKTALSFAKKALANDPEPHVRRALLDEVAGVDDVPQKACALIAARLEDDDVRVVESAGRALRKHPCPEALEPIRKAWAAAPHRLRKALAAAIEVLVADAALAPGNAELATWWAAQDKHPSRTGARVATIPLTTQGVLFIVDVSTYMKPVLKESPWKLEPAPAPTKGTPPPPPTSFSGPRVNLARHELQVALRKLPEDVYFNILKFNHGAALWQRSMQLATKANKDDANRWLRVMKASGASYAGGCLRLAFRLAGALPTGEVAMPEIDTIVLLSAGTTTDNSFPTHRPVEPEPILSLVRAWNRPLGLVLHTVAFGESEFLQKLAAQNGGTYARR